MRLLDLYNKNINKGFIHGDKIDFKSEAVTGFAFIGEQLRGIPGFFFNLTQFSKNIINKDKLASCTQWAILATISKPSEALSSISIRKKIGTWLS